MSALQEEYYKHEPLDFSNATDQDIEDRTIEILKRDVHCGWKPYMFFREVVGVDFITPGIDEIGQTIIGLQIRFMDEVKKTAVFRRTEQYLDDDKDYWAKRM